MKVQTGFRVEDKVWLAYRALCSRDKLRPSVPIEEFLNLVLENDSALGFLTLMQGTAKANAEGLEAYTRVLLTWYLAGKRYFNSARKDDESVEGLLLECLKVVSDPGLRHQIEEALIGKRRQAVNPE
jgi:hypothetical protein